MSQVAHQQSIIKTTKEPEEPPMRLPIHQPDASYQAFQILHIGFTVAPMVAGMDKYTNRLVRWEQYLSPAIPRRLGISGKTLMKAVGVFEILAGIGVAIRPRIFGYVISGWLAAAIGNLVMKRTYYDVALRDFGLLLGALALSKLVRDFDNHRALEKIASPSNPPSVQFLKQVQPSNGR